MQADRFFCSAVRTLDQQINTESQATDLGQQIMTPPSTSYTFENLYVVKKPMTPLPKPLLGQQKRLERKCFMGFFAEINRMWMTIDNEFYMWNFAGGQDFVYYDGLDQVIVSCALVPPRPGVFLPEIKYLLVLATQVEVVLFGLAFSNGQVDGEAQLFPTQLSTPTDSVAMLHISATANGRILMGGRDGCLYELLYQQEDGWFTKRCRKVNLTKSRVTSLLPTFFKFHRAEDALLQVAVDHSRNIAYTLSERGTIVVYDLGQQGDKVRCVYSLSQLPRLAKQFLSSPALAAPGVTGRAVQLAMKEHALDPVCLMPIHKTESAAYHLVAVTADGARLYFTAIDTYSLRASTCPRPSTLALAKVQLPPPFAAQAGLGTAAYHAPIAAGQTPAATPVQPPHGTPASSYLAQQYPPASPYPAFPSPAAPYARAPYQPPHVGAFTPGLSPYRAPGTPGALPMTPGAPGTQAHTHTHTLPLDRAASVLGGAQVQSVPLEVKDVHCAHYSSSMSLLAHPKSDDVDNVVVLSPDLTSSVERIQTAAGSQLRGFSRSGLCENATVLQIDGKVWAFTEVPLSLALDSAASPLVARFHFITSLARMHFKQPQTPSTDLSEATGLPSAIADQAAAFGALGRRTALQHESSRHTKEFNDYLDRIATTPQQTLALIPHAPATMDLALQHLYPPRTFLCLTTAGLHVVAQQRPINQLQRILARSGGKDTDDLALFFAQYGADEACAMCLALACTSQSTASQLISGAGLSPSHGALPPDQNVTAWATRAFFKLGGAPKLTRDEAQNLPTTFAQPEVQYSGCHNGFMKYLGRLLAPQWFLPVVVPCATRLNEDAPLFAAGPRWTAALSPCYSSSALLSRLPGGAPGPAAPSGQGPLTRSVTSMLTPHARRARDGRYTPAHGLTPSAPRDAEAHPTEIDTPMRTRPGTAAPPPAASTAPADPLRSPMPGKALPQRRPAEAPQPATAKRAKPAVPSERRGDGHTCTFSRDLLLMLIQPLARLKEFLDRTPHFLPPSAMAEVFPPPPSALAAIQQQVTQQPLPGRALPSPPRPASLPGGSPAPHPALPARTAHGAGFQQYQQQVASPGQPPQGTPLRQRMHEFQHRRQDQHAAILEQQSLVALGRVLHRSIETLQLLLILTDYPFPDLVAGLTPELQKELSTLTFRELVSTAEGALIAQQLISQLMDQHALRNGTVDSLSRTLKTQCRSFFNPSHTLAFKAKEFIEKAKGTETPQLRLEMLQESLKILLRIPTDVALDDIAPLYIRLRYHCGVVDLAIAIAHQVDESGRALVWVRSGSPETDVAGIITYQARMRAYTWILKALADILGRVYEPEQVDAEGAPQAPPPPSSGDATQLLLTSEALHRVVNSSDELLHQTAYTWLIREGLAQDVLLALKSSFLESFLQQHNQDLLWQFYVRNSLLAQAGEVLRSLAQSTDARVSLQDRIRYLSLAIGNFSSCAGMNDQVRQLQDSMDVAQVQNKIRMDLHALLTRHTTDDTMANSIQDALRQLDTQLYAVTDLYHTYAQPYNLHESCLAIFHCAKYHDLHLIHRTWDALLKEEVLSLASTEATIPTVSATVQRLGKLYYPAETIFPLPFLCDRLEHLSFQIRGTASWSPTWVIALLRAVGVDFGTIYDHYAALGASQTTFWRRPECRCHIYEAIASLMLSWLEVFRVPGQRGTPSERAALEARNLPDAVIHYLVQLDALPQAENIIALFKTIGKMLGLNM